MQSYVDLRTHQLQHYIGAIRNYIRVHPLVKEKLNCCTCVHYTLEKSHQQNFLSGPVEDLIESTWCVKRVYPHLGVGAGSSFITPKLFD